MHRGRTCTASLLARFGARPTPRPQVALGRRTSSRLELPHPSLSSALKPRSSRRAQGLAPAVHLGRIPASRLGKASAPVAVVPSRAGASPLGLRRLAPTRIRRRLPCRASSARRHSPAICVQERERGDGLAVSRETESSRCGKLFHRPAAEAPRSKSVFRSMWEAVLA